VTREDIIRMAREAGICTGNSILLPAPDGQIEALDRFAALVAAAEREACAKVCEDEGSVDDLPEHYAAAIRSRGEVQP
jgi:hypothetical protein